MILNYDDEGEKLGLLLHERSSEMCIEAQVDGSNPPFLIQATDADGNIVATLLFDGDGKEEITCIDFKASGPDFLRVPISLTLTTMNGKIRRGVLYRW